MPGMPLKDPWSASDRYVPRTVVQPLQRVLHHEAAGGIVMLVAAVVAIAWANSPWSASYTDVWQTPLRVELGGLLHLDHLSLQAWVNDALMTLFFLLVGLEIKREAVHGELRDLRSVTLPVVAALGGMVVPAAIYAALNHGGPGADGWAVPMATDIAFAVGVVTLAGRRVPLAAKIFLLTLAVADDIGAIVVIAVFYTGALSLGWLACAAVGLATVFVLRRNDVQSLAPYLAAGAFSWLALLESGVHATLIGVALGLLTPAKPTDPRGVSDVLDKSAALSLETDAQNVRAVTLEAQEVVSVAERLEHLLHPYTSYIVIPLFALANAGVLLDGEAFRAALSSNVTLGIVSGLVLGKIIGISAMSWLAVRLKLGRLPEGVGKRHLVGGAAVAGIGFTVSLFITALAFDDPNLIDPAKIGVFTASIIAGLVGAAVLFAAPKVTEDD
jgi:NhaA family Na+:H+ antiporter